MTQTGISQKILNSSRMDQWEYEGNYEMQFRLPLNARQALAVGKWMVDKEWGVDLRRWNYNQQRLLSGGITLQAITWIQLSAFVLELYEKRCFSKSGKIASDNYEKEINIDERYSLITSLFESDIGDPYLSVTLYKNGIPQVRRFGRSLAILIRFDTIPELLSKCQTNKLIELNRPLQTPERHIDEATGKEIF